MDLAFRHDNFLTRTCSMLDLTPEEVLFINSRHHIYFPASGRINVAALNEENIPRFAKAIHEAIAQ